MKGDWVNVSNEESFDSKNNQRPSPFRKSESRCSLGRNSPPIEQFIHETGYKHQVICLSCETPILNQLQSQRKAVEKEEVDFLEQIRQLRKQQEISQGKLEKYQKKALEALQALVEHTKLYNKTKKEHDGDFKRILDAEIKYKMAFYNYSDVKNKWLDKKAFDDNTRETIVKTRRDLKKKLSDLKTEADQVFVSIVQHMAKFFIYINTKEGALPTLDPGDLGEGSNVQVRVEEVSDNFDEGQIDSSDRRHPAFPNIRGSIGPSAVSGGSLAGAGGMRAPTRSVTDNAFSQPLIFRGSYPASTIVQRTNIHQIPHEETKSKAGRAVQSSVDRERRGFTPQYELLDNDPSPTLSDRYPNMRIKSQQQLWEEFDELAKKMLQVPDLIDQKIQSLDPISNFIVDVSLAFDEYLKNIIKITFNEKGEEIIAYLADLEQEFRGQTDFFIRFQRAQTLEVQRRSSQNFKFITQIERLESLQAKIRQTVK